MLIAQSDDMQLKAKHMYSTERHRLVEKYIALEIQDKFF